MSHKNTDIRQHTAPHGSLRSCTIGYVLSLVLTFAAYLSVTNNLFAGNILVLVLMGLAMVQLVVQLIFFLHLGSESKPRFNLIIFLFMLLVLLIIVIGSLWIMNNLDYHTMSPKDTDSYLRNKEGL